MEETAVLERPEAEAPEGQAGASAESASQPAASDAEINATMNALLRGGLAQASSSSNPDAADQGTDDADAEAGVSAPPGDVKPADAKAPGRRGAAARIAELEAENARLKAEYEAANPPPPDASEETRKAIIAREQRYRTLAAKDWDDQDWTEDDVNFFKSEQKKRAVAPELRQHYETVVEQDLQANRATVAAERDQFWTHVRSDLASAKDVPGVDFEAVKAATTFAERDRLMYTAGRSQLEPELKRLRDENADLKRDLMGSVRTPLNGGRSAPGSTYDENTYMNTLLRGGRV